MTRTHTWAGAQCIALPGLGVAYHRRALHVPHLFSTAAYFGAQLTELIAAPLLTNLGQP
jgi:hypothetical protein